MQSSLEYRLALFYTVIGSMGWLGVAITQWNRRTYFITGANERFQVGDGETARQALDLAGARTSEVLIAALLMLVFMVCALMLYRRTWNSWDWASGITGIASVLSLVLLCAGGRVIYAAPFTLAPLWLLLYRPAVKQACGVGERVHADSKVEVEVAETETIDLRQEQELLTGLRQSLRVFEIEQAMDTDTFVSRYSRGLEEESDDNEEWFALARLARRTEDRIAQATGTLSPQE